MTDSVRQKKEDNSNAPIEQLSVSSNFQIPLPRKIANNKTHREKGKQCWVTV